MKKIISFFVLIIILFNFIFCNKVYADEDYLNIDLNSGTPGLNEDTYSSSQQKSLFFGGRGVDYDSEGNERQNDASRDAAGGSMVMKIIAQLLCFVLNVFPLSIQLLMMLVAYDGEGLSKFVTIEDMVFGNIDVLSIDFFDDTCNSEMIKSFRKSVSQYFYTFRIIAAALNLLTLLYIGIRMALSLTSNDKAKYKKMLIGWVESIILLFTIHYIIALFVELGEIFTNSIKQLKVSTGATTFEETIINKIYSFIDGDMGWSYVLYSIIFWILVGIQTKFFIAYSKRVITVGFLILISPIISVIFALDKAGDGKAQSFSNWMREFGVNVFIQPVEALIYVVFMIIAGKIAESSLLVATLLLLGITKIEKIMLQMFNVKGSSLHAPHEQGKK